MAVYAQEAALVSEGRRIAGQLVNAIYEARTLAMRNTALGAAAVGAYLDSLTDGDITKTEWNQGLLSMDAIATWVDTEQHDRKLEKIR